MSEIDPTTESVKKTESITAPVPRRSVTLTMPELKRPKIPSVPKTGRLRAGLLATAFLLTAVLGGIAGGWLENRREATSFADGISLDQKKLVTQESQLISQIAKTVGPSVVSVNVTVTADSPDIPPELEEFFGVRPSQPTQSGAGTGIIINEEGVIITNRHVVPEGTDTVSVTLSDGTELTKVSVLGRTKTNDSLDIAFLKIDDKEGKKLVPARIGDSSKVQVGDDVVAIGNALGRFQNTVTSGIISGFGRSVLASSEGSSDGDVESLDNLFQTDAAINQGNSGGPLVNLNGQVIGINTAVAGNAQNVGFAIPTNDIKGLIAQVLKNGKVVRPYIGVRYLPLTADVAKQNNLSVMDGAYILPVGEGEESSVLSGSPADKAGLKPGDVITKVAGKTINESNSLTSLLSAFQPGERTELTISRDGKNQKISITLGSTESL